MRNVAADVMVGTEATGEQVQLSGERKTKQERKNKTKQSPGRPGPRRVATKLHSSKTPSITLDYMKILRGKGKQKQA